MLLTTFPPVSSTLTTGCVPKAAPLVAVAAEVVRTIWLAAPVVTVTVAVTELTPGEE